MDPASLEDIAILEHVHRQALQRGPLLILISRMRDDSILDANQTMQRLLGYSREEMIGRTTIELGILVDTDQRERVMRSIYEKERVGDFEAKLRTRSGEIRQVLLTVEMTEVGGEPCFLRMAYDVTERKKADDALLKNAYHDALHDSLTGLPNRALFVERLGRSIERSRRDPDYQFAVLFLDIDHLKAVNDSFGHMLGDQLLIAAGERMAGCLNAKDTLSRFGGDEFAMLVEDARDVSQALSIADEVQEALRRSFELDGQRVTVSASIGIAWSASGYRYPEEVLQDADKAMYRAKSNGRAKNEVFDTALHAQAVDRLQLKTDLLSAVEQHGFQVVYQPIVALEDGQIIGFEALGRWLHPDRGPVSPAEFIALAEETGLIIDFGRWMLREASKQMKQWQQSSAAHASLQLNVNLSGKEFTQPDLIDQIRDTLHETDLDPASLSLEVAEGSIMKDPEAGRLILKNLRTLGTKIYIDDFGTGHSSLSFMYQFPVDALKIARSFVHRMGTAGKNDEIVRTISMLARDFGMQVVAEGVETADQFAHLRRLKCTYGQGFYFSKPLDRTAATKLLNSDPRW